MMLEKKVYWLYDALILIENEQIQLMLSEVESSITNISDASVFKSVIQILRDVIVIVKDR